jgi:hypothetical protein
LPITQNSERCNDHDACRYNSPSQRGPSQPTTARDYNSSARLFHSRQGKRDYVAAIPAPGKVLQHGGALVRRQRLLAKRGQHVCVGMLTDRHRRLQTLAHDLWDIWHFSF